MGKESGSAVGAGSVVEMLFKKKEIDKLPFAPKGVTLLYRDTSPGSVLRLKVGVSKKTFYVHGRRRVGEKNIVNKVIPHDPKSYDLDELREAAAKILDTPLPGELEKPRGDELTVRQAYAKWRALYGEISIANTKGKSPRYLDDTWKHLNRYVPDWLDRDLRDITEQEWLDRYKKLTPLGRTPARKTGVALSILVEMAIRTNRDKGFYNFTRIVAALNVEVPTKRNEYRVSDEELGRFIIAALDLRANPPEGMRSNNQLEKCIDLHLLQLFTGMRPGELRETPLDKVQLLRKSFKYDEEYAMRVRKSGQEIEIPLSDVAWTFVDRQYDPRNFMLFQSPTEPEKSIAESSAREYLKLIFKHAGLKPIPKKALRNIFQQHCRLAEVPLHDWKALVDHTPKQKDISVSYTYDDPDHLRKQAQKITDLMLKRTGIRKELFGLKAEETNKFNELQKLLAEFSKEELQKLGIEKIN